MPSRSKDKSCEVSTIKKFKYSVQEEKEQPSVMYKFDTPVMKITLLK